eukprot:1154344-Pelagomonas_calceolata.AAC.11
MQRKRTCQGSGRFADQVIYDILATQASMLTPVKSSSACQPTQLHMRSCRGPGLHAHQRHCA